jgi:hypothetical protein
MTTGVLASSRRPMPASTGEYRAAVLADAPYCYFPLDDPTTPTDVMGRVVPTSWLGLTLGATGIGDGVTSGQFDGGTTNRGVILPNAALPSPSTLTSWAVEVIAQANDMGIQRGIFGTESLFLLRHSVGPLIDSFHGIGSWANRIGAAGVPEPDPAGTHHWAIVWDGPRATLYRDGEVAISEATTAAPLANHGAMYIGGRATTDKTFLGRLAGYAYYDHALTPERVLAHAQAAAVP